MILLEKKLKYCHFLIFENELVIDQSDMYNVTCVLTYFISLFQLAVLFRGKQSFQVTKFIFFFDPLMCILDFFGK